MRQLINQRFIVDFDRCEIEDLSTGRETHLAPSVLQILEALSARKDKAISKAELLLLDSSWNETNLVEAIHQLRVVLDDQEHRLIKEDLAIGFYIDATVEAAPKEGASALLPPFSVLMMLLMVLLGLFFVYYHYRP